MLSESRWLVLSALLALAFPAACGSSGVVGGKCRAGYLNCKGQCVDTQNDPANCGACAKSCDPGVACENAVCGGLLDGSAGTAGSAGSSSAAAGATGSGGEAGAAGGAGNAGNGNAGNGNAGNAGKGNGGATSDDGGPGDCPPPWDSSRACGNCDTRCADPTPICSPDGLGSFKCVLDCDVGFTQCGDQCIDTNIDPDHCGGCLTPCLSGICQKAKCVGANVGHIVLACMDYAQPTAGTPQTVLLGNAIFLPIRNPVRILAYSEFAPAAARARVDQDIGFAATARGRTDVITTVGKSANVTAGLNINDYEVFLIYDQPAAATGQLGTVGAAWQTSTVLASFAAAGGVIVAVDGGGGIAEMNQLFTSAQLLDVSAETSAANVTLYNRAPGDAVGINVLSPFLAPKNSCTFTTTVTPDADTLFVVQDAKAPAAGSPVVVHRVIQP